MSFDVQIQSFSAAVGFDRFVTAVRPFVASSDSTCWQLRFTDGEADLYVDDDGAMVSHVSGVQAWDVLVRAAHAADCVLLAPADVVCITRREQVADLPDELRSRAVLVTTGQDFLAAVEDA